MMIVWKMKFILSWHALCDNFFCIINSFIVNFDCLSKWDQFLFLMSSDDAEVLSLLLAFDNNSLKLQLSSGNEQLLLVLVVTN